MADLHTSGEPLKSYCPLEYYKDRQCAVNEKLSLRIIASIHYNVKDLIVK